MNCYWFNRQEILQKEKAAEYYLQNKEAKEKSIECYKNLSQVEKRQDKGVSKKKISGTCSV